jgi:polysaccharide export outer membrane protein
MTEAARTETVGTEHTEPLLLREADVLKISFLGAPSLNTTQTIRRDGKITLPDGGEMDAAGKTPTELEKDLADHYASQLVSKEVTVTVQSSSFPIFVTGAVAKPGKVIADHPMTVLEAVMESGGFDYSRANLKAVKIIREKPPGNFTLNFKGLLEGHQPEAFYLKPFDIVYVPEKFSWF